MKDCGAVKGINFNVETNLARANMDAKCASVCDDDAIGNLKFCKLVFI